MKFLVLYLCSPMQSWGASSKFDVRGTSDIPTKSALIGLLGAACGIDRKDDGWVHRAAELELSLYVFQRGERLRDYHTVGARYDKKDPWKSRMIPLTAENKSRGTDVTHRYYLQDSIYGAIFAGKDDELIEQMAQGLKNPIWGIWLGRKSCIPTEPVYAGVFDQLESGVNALKKRFQNSCQRRKNSDQTEFSISSTVTETGADDGDELVSDVPISFAERTFGTRFISRRF